MLAENTPRTVTETINPDLPLVLFLSPQPSLKRRLEDILINFGALEDPLSEDLLAWAARTYLIISADGFKRNAELKQSVLKRIHKLRDQKLINPIDGTPDKEPVLERQWKWERWMVEEYKTCWKRIYPQLPVKSPFDQQDMQPSCPHMLAQELQKWGDAFLMQMAPSDSTKDIALCHQNPFVFHLSPLREMDDLPKVQHRLTCYLALAKASNVKDFARAAKREIKMANKQIVQIGNETRERMAQEAMRIEEMVRAHQHELEEQIESIKSLHQQREEELTHQLQQEVTRAAQIQVQTQHMLEQEAERNSERRRIQQEELNRQIENIEQNHQNVEQVLNSRLAEDERMIGYVQEQNRVLSHEITLTREQHQVYKAELENRVKAIVAEHLHRDQMLTSQIAHAQQLLNNINQQCNASNATVQAQQRQINRLNALTQVRANQVHHLKKKVKKKKFGIF